MDTLLQEDGAGPEAGGKDVRHSWRKGKKATGEGKGSQYRSHLDITACVDQWLCYGTIDPNRPPWPGTIITTCMSCLITGCPDKHGAAVDN